MVNDISLAVKYLYSPRNRSVVDVWQQQSPARRHQRCAQSADYHSQGIDTGTLDDDDSPSFQLTKMSSTWNARANTTTIILGRRKLYNNVISYIYSASNQAIYTEQLQLLSTDVKTTPWIYDTITMADRLWIVTL